jgi:prolycopene isomerase
VVISNADAWQTFERLIGLEALPERFVRRMQRLEPSPSAFVVYCAVTLELAGQPHEKLLFPEWDHEKTFRDLRVGRPGGMWATMATLIDPSLAPAGTHLVTLSSLAAYDIGEPWESAKDRFADEMLTTFERMMLPGLRNALVHVEWSTPETIERRTGHHHGAAYGWEHTPKQAGGRRLAHDSPVPGLYVSGHWSVDAPGSFFAILSSIRTAQVVLEQAGQRERAPVIQPPDMPLPV